MAAPIVVTGGTGTLGRLVVPRLRSHGHEVRVVSRSAPDTTDGVEHVAADLSTGDGVGAALRGAEVVLHLAGSSKGDEVKAQHLVRAAEPAGVRHLVFISVVGADRVPIVGGTDRAMFGYYGAKLAAERVIAGSGIPWTTLRATQFHQLILLLMRTMAKMPIVPVPSGLRAQPIDGAEVADRLVELALGAPAGLVPDIAGPSVYGMDELVRSYLRAAGKRRPLIPMRMPGKAAAALREGANLAPARAVGRRTWEEFLAEEVRSDASSPTSVAV